jgi:type IV secretory pathway VirJ component
MASQRSRSLRWRLAWIAGIAGGVLALLAGIAASAGFFDRDAAHLFGPQGIARPIGVLYVSGDMGLRYGPNPHTVRALAGQGFPVVALSSPALFGLRRTRAEVDRIVADGVRAALARTGAARLMLIGQSYGADVLQTGLADLPVALRSHVAGVVLVVPGETVFFRADPSGLVYRGTPDSESRATLARLGWTHLTCIYGAAEVDSACPDLLAKRATGRGAGQPGQATVVAMPGGHFLNDDRAGLFAHILAAIRHAAPDAFAR